ncbi:MAG: hypothetical protein J5741_01295 [Bacteroidales bacterium]|nr:hypothetical protein [Bacteroidales bacterium]
MSGQDFIKKNLNIYHIIGMVVGVGLSMIYWVKSGQFSDNFLKKSPVLMAIWGILIGYILCDLVFNSQKRKEDENKRQEQE